MLFRGVRKLLNPLVVFNLLLLMIVVVSGAILFMVMVGMIQFPNDPDRKAQWYEINAQILNACFTITAVMTQPIRFMMILWTYRWYRYGNVGDAKKIEAIMPAIKFNYNDELLTKEESSSQTTGKVSCELILTELAPSESAIISVSEPYDVGVDQSKTTLRDPNLYVTANWKWILILFCLNGQCVFQYPITFAQWAWIGYATARPAWVIATFLPLSFLCGSVGGIWPFLIERKPIRCPAANNAIAVLDP